MNCVAIIGLIVNTIASIILAYSLNDILKGFDNSITALEAFKDSFLSTGDTVSFTGLDKHRKRGLKNATMLTRIGLLLLIIGFALQLVSLII